MTPEEIAAMQKQLEDSKAYIVKLSVENDTLKSAGAGAGAKPTDPPATNTGTNPTNDPMKTAIDGMKTENDRVEERTYLKRSIADSMILSNFIKENVSPEEFKNIENQLKNFNNDSDLEQDFLAMKILQLKDSSLDTHDKLKAVRDSFDGKYTSKNGANSGLRALIDGFIEQTNQAKANRPTATGSFAGIVPQTLEEANVGGRLAAEKKYNFV